MVNSLLASKSLLNDFQNANACQLIAENRACNIMDFRNKKIVVVASCSSGIEGVKWVTAYNVTPINFYKELVSTYNEHFNKRDLGSPRGYKGVSIKTKNGDYVITGESFTIEPIRENVQLSFF
jgi:hypothetical protein